MELIKDIDAAIESGVDGFKKIIAQRLAQNKFYLEQPYWMPDGSQMTVLNYLIYRHQEGKTQTPKSGIDLSSYIDFVIDHSDDRNIGEPVHQAIIAGKLQLAIYLLARNQKQSLFDMHRRNKQGRTLLSLTLATKNQNLLNALLANKPPLQETTFFAQESIAYQPLHEAIALDFAYGVNVLAHAAGTQLDNPVGPLRDTPLLLAARLGKIKALKALLSCPIEKLALEADGNAYTTGELHGDNALEALCRLLEKNPNKSAFIEGIAMLFCHGAEPPRSIPLCDLLANHRTKLLNAIDAYLEMHPELVDRFVARCHVADSSLYRIIYVDNSWSNGLRQLFGKPGSAAFMVESWLTRKYSKPSKEHPGTPDFSARAAATFTGDEDPLKLYAEFVRRYHDAYDRQRFANPWSTMRWRIVEGDCNWNSVLQYSKTHPASRTRIIINDMLKMMPKATIHDDLDSSMRHRASAGVM